MVMTYEVKLNTSDNHKGYRRMQPHNLDYTHEVATVFKTKDEMLRGIMDRFDSQSGAMTDKEIYREKFTQTILADIQLFEATTKVMSMGDSAQKLAADLHVLTQAAIVEMNTAMSSSTSLSEDEFRLHTDIAQTATESPCTTLFTRGTFYPLVIPTDAVRVLGLIRYAKVEDIQRESGMKYLHDALTTSGATPKHRLLARLAMAKMLKAVVETPSCSGKCMPNDHFAQHKSLMGAMSEAAEKLALSYLNPSETYLPSLNQLTEEFVRDIKFLWDTLYNKRAGLCEVFENAQVLFSKYLTQNRVINQHPVEKVKKLLSSERELLSILTTIPHPLKSEDKTFQRMLQCPTVGAATAKVRLSTTLAKLSSANTECHTALSNVLRNMELIVNDIISPL
ncbi:hypothetical protein D915_002691 [Fasciola hepatica]|uniref:Uncharacterized protein n=1 Tax=Fasciola hepatica TaxID=6192 RepID=A0A4E0RHH3_FASHE|nr:hypothetical protein D915_002691 [Fasciola hepatica]